MGGQGSGRYPKGSGGEKNVSKAGIGKHGGDDTTGTHGNTIKVTFDTSPSSEDMQFLGRLKKTYDYKVVKMSPDEFLTISNTKNSTIDSKKVNTYVDKIKKSPKNIPILVLTFNEKMLPGENSNFHDGSHRALALKKLNVGTISVLVFTNRKDTPRESAVKFE
jgi:hypothetical protein